MIPLLPPGIGRFQHLLHHVGFQKLQLTFAGGAEAGIQIDGVEIIADHVGAETVDGVDLSVVNQRLLPLQMLIVRLLLKPPLHRRRQPLPHLPGRRPGERHNEKTVDIHRIFLAGHHGQNPLHQHRRLTGSCGGTHQDIPVGQVNHLFLFFCPLYGHDFLLFRPYGHKGIPGGFPPFPAVWP